MWLQVKESLGHQQLEAAGRVFLEEVCGRLFVFSRLLKVVAPPGLGEHKPWVKMPGL